MEMRGEKVSNNVSGCLLVPTGVGKSTQMLVATQSRNSLDDITQML